MERRGRTEIIAQVAGLASQANKLLAMLLADGDFFLPESTPDPIPASIGTVKAPAMGEGMGKAGDSMSLKEVALYARYCERSIQRLIQDKDFPAHQDGPHAKLHFYRDEVDAWIKERKRKGHGAMAGEANAILNGGKGKGKGGK
jgi:excisionase family DNA binding protein